MLSFMPQPIPTGTLLLSLGLGPVFTCTKIKPTLSPALLIYISRAVYFVYCQSRVVNNVTFNLFGLRTL